MIEKSCSYCSKKFFLPNYRNNQGRGKYCSMECYDQSRLVEDKKQNEKFAQVKCRYGLSKDQYLSLVELADGKCSICKKSDTSLVIDHCHSTKVVRGLICQSCNKALGLFEDNVEFLENAISYLKK